MVGAFRDWFLDQLAMYAAYHRDRRNQATHYVGVPLIIFSVLIVLVQARLGGAIDAATLALGLLLLGYFVAVPALGLLSLIIYVPLYLLAETVGTMEATPRWLIAAGGFVGGWTIQFVGHVFEGRRPAFITNALQLFMAPAFLVAEVMFAMGLLRNLADVLQARGQKYAR